MKQKKSKSGNGRDSGKRRDGALSGKRRSKVNTGGRTTGKKQKSDNISFGKITGKIDVAVKGCGFIPDPYGGKDIYVSANHLYGALSGDTVEAAMLQDGTAKVTRVIERGSKFMAGYYMAAGSSSVLLAKNKKFPDVLLKKPINDRHAPHNGDLLIVNTDNFDVVKNLGSGEKAELMSLVYSFGYVEGFPSAVKKEAAAVSQILPSDYLGRTDFRQDTVFTIDGEDSRDFDDAVSIIENADGFVLSVHIADVSHYVREGSFLDKEAFNRGTSVYFPYAVIPMLPPELSNGICSLNEGEDRLTLTVTAHINSRGTITDYKICKSVINSSARLTYNNTQAILDGIDNPIKQHKNFAKIASSLKSMQKLAAILIKKREKRGAVEFSSSETHFTMDGFTVKNVERKEQLFTHRLIEEFMILANILVAKSMRDKEPFVYRVHTPPSPEKLERLKAFLQSIGLSHDFDEEVTPKEISALLLSVPQELRDVVSAVALRSMSKACYENVCRGHFGLSLTHYCHFTSPIRRYPDLIVHRILKDKLSGIKINKYAQFVADACLQSSLTERKGEEAERKADDYLKALYMAGHIGESYDGIISGITSWGIFVVLQNTVEGLIRVEKLDGRYEYDESSLTLRGERIFRLGDKLRIEILSVFEDRIEMGLVYPQTFD